MNRGPGASEKTDLREPITELFRAKPFTSCKARHRRLKIPKTTCFRVFDQKFDSTKFYLRWVPHTLDANQMSDRITSPNQLLQLLKLDEEHNFRNIVTGDESWFFLKTSVTSG
jgi:hypothetical protein